MKKRIKDIVIKARYRKTHKNIERLAESIQTVGLLQPIVVDMENQLICGARRIKAYEFLGRDEIPTRQIDIKNLLLGEYAENIMRENFTLDEKVAIGEAVEKEMGNRQGQRTDTTLVEILPQVEKGEKTRQVAAERAGFGNETTYRQAKVIAAKASPEVLDKIDSGKSTINREYKAIVKAKEKKEQVEAVVSTKKGKINGYWLFQSQGHSQLLRKYTHDGY
ncbi:MAG: ParB/RepB/Spo0J family partition protein [Patescibacteria group bacterium]|nr:ParB/RepB/Spo0J family partition protein [Patescibacteria group bacterium]